MKPQTVLIPAASVLAFAGCASGAGPSAAASSDAGALLDASTSSDSSGRDDSGHGACIFDVSSFDDGCVFASSADQDASAADASAADAGVDAPTNCKANVNLAEQILSDPNIATTKTICTQILSNGFTAGSGYPQIWTRDTNTFILPLLDIVDPATVRAQLLEFFDFQGSPFVDVGSTAGNIVDGIYTGTPPSAFKTSSETDQESSLIQAVTKYVNKTNDRSILTQVVNGETVLNRMADALEYLMTNRYSSTYGLLWGATTADWGDNQPEDVPGATLDYLTHPAIDIYDNAMFVLALQGFISLGGDTNGTWAAVLQDIQNNVRKYLWDGKKFIPHLYLERGSPFPTSFDERSVLVHGGHAVAMEAGLVSADEAAALFAAMQQDVALAGARTIGLTQYPPYPAGFFLNPSQTLPYTYQNAGDWPWFGGRLVNQAVRLGFPDFAYSALQPMLALFVRDSDINEWYTPDGTAAGSGQFTGGAGVIATAIQSLEQWANAQLASNCE